jgi:hypothetical protein
VAPPEARDDLGFDKAAELPFHAAGFAVFEQSRKNPMEEPR